MGRKIEVEEVEELTEKEKSNLPVITDDFGREDLNRLRDRINLLSELM